MGHCPSCENPDAISLCFAYFSSLAAAASSWHHILPLPGPGREKASFPTMFCWAWTNQVSDWMLGVDWLIPKMPTTSLSIIVRGRVVQAVWLLSNRAYPWTGWCVYPTWSQWRNEAKEWDTRRSAQEERQVNVDYRTTCKSLNKEPSLELEWATRDGCLWSFLWFSEANKGKMRWYFSKGAICLLL